MVNMVLAGGNGTRLWPISQTNMPKQFIKFFNNNSLFQLTVKRNLSICKNQIIISNTEQYFLALNQLEEINLLNSKYILEELGRNTAPAIALACFSLNSDEIVLVTPSDHLIKNEQEYEKVVDIAKSLAEKNNIVLFGITPTAPEIGYGYIESNGLDVKAFYEKPDLEKSKKYINNKNFYWNSGIFCFKVKIFLEELKKYAPEIYNSSKKAFENSFRTLDTIHIKKEDMIKIPDDSIDYAVMEKSNISKVISSSIEWSDLGSFDMLFNELEKDENNNTINQMHISLNSKNNLIYSKDKYIATIDIEDLIVVDTKDALLISKKGSSQSVKKIVTKIKKMIELDKCQLMGYRPWGTYNILDENKGYKIKKIIVQAGKRLSLQKHFHRNEHWILLSGTATVTVGNTKKILRPNESTYIKMGEIHRLENEGKIPVVLIEVQVGEYTGEDDIVRLEDDYLR